MKKKVVSFTSLLLSGLMCFGAVGCGFSKDKEGDVMDSTCSENFPEEQASFKAIFPENGKEISVVNEEMENFLEQEELVGVLVDAYVTNTDNFAPKLISLSWECEKTLTDCVVTVATDREFTKNVAVYHNAHESVPVIENSYVNCEYFWEISATTEDGERLESNVFSFKVNATPRTVNIPGVSNTRDIGGYNVADGKVKQGMIYRTAKFDDITEDGLFVANERLKVKTDLDLRNVGEGSAGGTSPLGCEKYLRLTSPYYSIFSTEQKAQVREIMKVFADETNYPIAMHCSLGRDRTGTIAFLLNAFLGVAREDLRTDYFLSCFSKAGTVLDGASYVVLEKNFNGMYDQIDASYQGENYAKKVEAYLLSADVTLEELNEIKRIMLE